MDMLGTQLFVLLTVALKVLVIGHWLTDSCTKSLSFVQRFVLFRSVLYQRFHCTPKPPAVLTSTKHRPIVYCKTTTLAENEEKLMFLAGATSDSIFEVAPEQPLGLLLTTLLLHKVILNLIPSNVMLSG